MFNAKGNVPAQGCIPGGKLCSAEEPDQLDGTADLESLSQRHLGDSGGYVVGTSLVAPPRATSGKWLLPRPNMHYEVVGKSFPAGQGSSQP